MCDHAGGHDDGGDEDAEDGSEVSEAQRAARGFHTVWSCAYFRITNDFHFPDAKMIMLPVWAAESGLTPSSTKSRTELISRCDPGVGDNEPVQTYMHYVIACVDALAGKLHRPQKN